MMMLVDGTGQSPQWPLSPTHRYTRTLRAALILQEAWRVRALRLHLRQRLAALTKAMLEERAEQEQFTRLRAAYGWVLGWLDGFVGWWMARWLGLLVDGWINGRAVWLGGWWQIVFVGTYTVLTHKR